MSKRALLSAIPDARKVAIWHEEDGRKLIETRQDCDGIIEFVKARAQMPSDKDFKPIGEIPLATLGQAFREGWADDDKAWRKWFRENPKFTLEWHR